MAYTITSDRLDSPKKLGDSIIDEELLEMGANIEALVEGGHLSTGGSVTAPTAKPTTSAETSAPVTPEGATE
jgi:hypothetical protein